MEVDITTNNFTIQCNATGQPIPKFKWYKDEMEITADISHKYIGDSITVSQLLRKRLQPSDSGIYRCVATNDGGIDGANTTVIIQGQC